jgi:tetratricopeptide (TPR) repeat protein
VSCRCWQVSWCGRPAHEDAAACYERALALEPGNARHHFSLAATYRFLGRLEEAESACDRALEIDPGEYEAYLVRSDLRTQTAERNHVAAMEAVLADLDAPYMGEVMLCHALAKECEDLGEHERLHLPGARCRAAATAPQLSGRAGSRAD